MGFVSSIFGAWQQFQVDSQWKNGCGKRVFGYACSRRYKMRSHVKHQDAAGHIVKPVEFVV
jgi:hypothetical protein